MSPRTKSASQSPLLSVTGLGVAYGKAQVVSDLGFDVFPGEVVVMLGRNGAGKTTILQAVGGLLPKASGRVIFDGQDVSAASPRELSRLGVHSVLALHRVFKTLSVEDNLVVGTIGASRAQARTAIDEVYSRFPELAQIRHLSAAKLSGGQQEILAVAQGIVIKPKLLLLDEPSSGLSPVMIDRILRVTTELAGQGVSVLLVEQLVEKSLRHADYCYLVETGRIAGDGVSSVILGSDLLEAVYFGRARGAGANRAAGPAAVA